MFSAPSVREERMLSLRWLGWIRLGRLHRDTRDRAGLRFRGRLALGLASGLLLKRRLLLREDRLLGLAGQQPLELILVDRLAIDQDRRQHVQVVHVLAEDAVRRGV